MDRRETLGVGTPYARHGGTFELCGHRASSARTIATTPLAKLSRIVAAFLNQQSWRSQIGQYLCKAQNSVDRHCEAAANRVGTAQRISTSIASRFSFIEVRPATGRSHEWRPAQVGPEWALGAPSATAARRLDCAEGPLQRRRLSRRTASGRWLLRRSPDSANDAARHIGVVADP